jgi:histidinol-phosphate aminotransferase
VSTFNYNNFFNPWLKETEIYQAGKTFEYVMQTYGYSRDQILRLAGNETTLGMSPLALKAAQDALPSSNFYDEPHSEFLIKAIEDHFSQEGINTSELGVVVGTGMDSVIEHCLINFTNINDSIVNLPPTFIYYDFAARRRGIEIINVNRDLVEKQDLLSFQVSLDKILKALKPNTKMVFLCSPNNPDGSIIELDFIEKLAEALLQKNMMLAK